MDFSPKNAIVTLCIQGMAMEEKGRPEDAGRLFLQAWNEATDDLEKYLAAFYVARHQHTVQDRLRWLETALRLALAINNDAVKGAYATLYAAIATCHEELGDLDQAKKDHALALSFRGQLSDKGPFYHGTRADLQIGDLLTAGSRSNYKDEVVMNHIYFTALMSGAGLAAALAKGEGRERVYVVEPTGAFENDPNVTDKKFPGNPTRSYRSKEPLRIVGEATDWAKQTADDVRKWREKLANSKGEIIN